jgi:hypothetical protein
MTACACSLGTVPIVVIYPTRATGESFQKDTDAINQYNKIIIKINQLTNYIFGKRRYPE